MRISIKTKMLIIYSLISFIVFLSFNFIVINHLKANNRKIISEDMAELKRRTLNFIDRDHYPVSSNIFDFNDPEMVSSLRLNLGINFNEQLIIYVNNKEVSEFAPYYRKYDFIETSFLNPELSILSYDINYIDNKGIVDFPIKFTRFNNNVIIRYFVDYSDMLMTERFIKTTMFVLSIIFSVIIVLLSMMNSNSIIEKVLKIKKFTKDVVKNDFNKKLKISSNDEMGELADDLNEMSRRLCEQISTIKKDRDEIARISNYKKVFYDNVTHELKTPLTTIIGYSELLLDECKGSLQDIEAIEVINSESNRLFDLVKSILDLSFYNEVDLYKNKELVDLSALITDIVERMNIKAKKYSIAISSHVDRNLSIYSNENALKSLFINLIDNSIKYNKINGNIMINVFKEQDTIKIIVEDTGIGIKQENINKIFKPFFTEESLSQCPGSSGLGLAIVDSIVKSHHGTIDVQSAKDIGTCIIVTLNINNS